MSVTAARRRAERWGEPGPAASAASELVAAEDPLALLVNGTLVATTMRTPGHDLDLALGWLVSEGVVGSAADVVAAREVRGSGERSDAVDLRLRPGLQAPQPRLSASTSACGVCGSARPVGPDPAASADRGDPPSREVLLGLPARMRALQPGFERTGGLHAAAVFTRDGELVVAREDVGRHNAVDKVVGWSLRQGRLPLRSHLVQVSGRAGYELVHKAALAGAAGLSAVSAPTTLAVDAARAHGLFLAAFVREGRATIFSAGGAGGDPLGAASPG